MRYDHQDLVDRVCGEYVLGLLKGGARRRCEQLIVRNIAWQQSVAWWETTFHSVVNTLPDVQPPKQTWKNIEQVLFAVKKPASRLSTLARMLTTALIASFVTFLLIQPPAIDSQAHLDAVAMLSNQQAVSGWHLSLKAKSSGQSEMIAYSLVGLEKQARASYELWMLPSGNAKPISLGLLPQAGSKIIPINPSLSTKLKASGLAVSIEPIGGSPTGQPTGAVLYQGKLVGM